MLGPSAKHLAVNGIYEEVIALRDLAHSLPSVLGLGMRKAKDVALRDEAKSDLLLEVAKASPATDRAAFACEWLGLGAALAMLGTAVIMAIRY